MANFNWVADTMHSEIGFQIRHLMISNVKGKFAGFEASAVADADFSKAEISFTAQVDSLNTGDATRDGHLKSPDFFDAAQFPTLTFKSTNFERTGENSTIHGDLTIHGVTKPITLSVEFGGIAVDGYGNTRAGFTIEGKISRKEFGLTWGAVTEAGNVILADDVKIACEIQMIKKDAVA